MCSVVTIERTAVFSVEVLECLKSNENLALPLSIWRVNYLISECKDHRLSSAIRQAPCLLS